MCSVLNMLRTCVFEATLVLCVVTCMANDPWWTTGHVYQVYTRSFKDSDGDGVGDLKGITSAADYFKEIGVDAIWLSPIFTSPMVDLGYDVTNFTEIDPLFGTMDDFINLKKKLVNLDVKLLLDFVPNHTSDKHPWFQSSSNTSHPLHDIYRDFYVWRDPKAIVNNVPIPPNNWFSVFGGSAWEWSEDRQQFFLHQFRVQQPDLNYRNPNVVSNMTDTLRFWMDNGVDGFRIDAVPWIYEDENFLDDPLVQGAKYATDIGSLQHIYERNRPETYELMRYWADFLLNRTLDNDNERLILLEMYEALDVTIKYYGQGNTSFEMPFNFLLMFMERWMTAYEIKYKIDLWMNSIPDQGIPNWVVGNHDQSRLATRYGPDMVDVMNMMTLVLPGIKVTYYGEEIGMTNTYVPANETVDKSIFSRDGFRTPMQWDDTTSAGFSNSTTTWLPVNPNFLSLNVAAQRSAQSSHLKVFQQMAEVRKDPVLQRGDLQVVTPDRNTIFIIRTYNGSSLLFMANIGQTVMSYSSKGLLSKSNLDKNYSVVVGSVNSGYNPGTIMQQGFISLTLKPKAALLLYCDAVLVSSAFHFVLSMCLLVLTTSASLMMT